MARKLSRSSKQLLSVLFHLAVLVCMVFAYDKGKELAVKQGWIEADVIEVETAEEAEEAR